MAGDWSSDEQKYIAIIVVIAVAVAIASAIVYFAYYFFAVRRPVPVDESSPFGVLCLSVQNADEIFHEDGKSMNAAVNYFNSILSRNLFRFGAIRSLREAELDHSTHVTIVGMNPGDLIDLALFLQKAAHQFQWGKNANDEVMEHTYHDFDDHYGVPRLAPETYRSLWGGLRIRMALHFGYGTVTPIPGTALGGDTQRELGVDSYIYGGNVVKECLFVEEHTFGGQILVSEQFRELLARETGHARRSSAEQSPTSPKQRASFSFVPCSQALFEDKVFACQLEIPGFEARRHPANSSARNLTVLDRTKSQKRAAIMNSNNSTSNGESPSQLDNSTAIVPVATSNPISSQFASRTSSNVAKTTQMANGVTKQPSSSSTAVSRSKETVIVYDEDDEAF